MESQSKKRKINPPPRRVNSTSNTVKETFSKVNGNSMAVSIQQARNDAVAQAQQEGCTANFRIFDSPFGNFLIPLAPLIKLMSRAMLKAFVTCSYGADCPRRLFTSS